MERFSRTERLLGSEAIERLQGSFVTVVGLGAVGGFAVEGLARAAVGHLRLVDFDIVKKHNINRQIVALESTLGEKKVNLLGQRVKSINPSCTVDELDIFADHETIGRILSPKPDLLIDAIDSLSSKVELLIAAYNLGIPTISSMGAALRTDPTKIITTELMDSYKCPLAKRIRKRLRQRGIGRGITCIFSNEDINFEYKYPESEPQDEIMTEDEKRGRKRVVLGSLPTITGIFGLSIANLALQRLSTGQSPSPSIP